MITSEEIVTVAQCFAGRTLTEREQEALADLCGIAQEQWTNQLREGVDPEDCRGPFLTASAWTALSYLSGAMEASRPGVLSFSAGDLSVRTGEVTAGSVCAKSLRAQAEELMAPYTRDEAFSFREVEG